MILFCIVVMRYVDMLCCLRLLIVPFQVCLYFVAYDWPYLCIQVLENITFLALQSLLIWSTFVWFIQTVHTLSFIVKNKAETASVAPWIFSIELHVCQCVDCSGEDWRFWFAVCCVRHRASSDAVDWSEKRPTHSLNLKDRKCFIKDGKIIILKSGTCNCLFSYA